MRYAHLRESHRTLRDGSFGVALAQALRARLRSHRPSGTKLCDVISKSGPMSKKPAILTKTSMAPAGATGNDGHFPVQR